MSATLLLPGITEQTVKTDRLRVAYLTAGTGVVPVVLVHGNGSSSLFFQDFMLALAARGRYTLYAPDLRGFGSSETLPVDATHGLRDFSEDLAAFVGTLGMHTFHLLGCSLGGNVAMQYALAHSEQLRSLTLQDPGPPYGFGGTKGAEGTAVWPDYAGSGGGMLNPDFVQRLARGDRGSEPFSPRTVLKTLVFKPSFQLPPDREEIYLTSMLLTKATPENFPGDFTTSPHWPGFAPGTRGVMNAFSPKYLNQASLAAMSPKPPVLWLRGADDQLVSDTSLFDPSVLGQVGLLPHWPGPEVCPPQPMVTQIRTVLNAYRANGGDYREVVVPDCGHMPLIEKQDEVVRVFADFVMAQEK